MTKVNRGWRGVGAERRAANATALREGGFWSGRFWFPGRWVGGTALVLGPPLMLTGLLLRIPFHFFFPQQLAAYDRHPALMTAAYACFVAGNVLLWPAVLTLARMIGATRPTWAVWGGALVMFGLFTRTFHGGIDHLAFQLVDVRGLAPATDAVADSYQAWHVFRFPAVTVLIGWVVLAVGAYLSGALGPVRAVALGLMSGLILGTLKGTEAPQSLIAVGGLCVAFVPLGIQLLRSGPRPSNRALRWLVVTIVLIVLAFFFAPEG
ncbi:hypothetical protein SAMN05421810_10144 [Amycolatopsis arida]|uniref:Uncharacterized protein n=1 Tax=Amycolatopsis arida TaxID=587909 RepID=A0A1I5K9P7_9PSEU|nr:hypothetical protein [Amycolatopsis arida]TDX96940.1 hypothetical protein CLV69_10242 [Amycolatopsis arida]SFO81463.1 hypothetical protein SAMN05421810_10144 [Amycolatopsis arida]